MFHPLLDDPSKLKDTELEAKITDLGQKYFMAARTGHGNICGQILTALDIYREEMFRRRAAIMEDLIKKQNKDMDGLINID